MQNMFPGIDSFSTLSSHRSCPKPAIRVFGGFLERSGSLERMDMEVTPRIFPHQTQHATPSKRGCISQKGDSFQWLVWVMLNRAVSFWPFGCLFFRGAPSKMVLLVVLFSKPPTKQDVAKNKHTHTHTKKKEGVLKEPDLEQP